MTKSFIVLALLGTVACGNPPHGSEREPLTIPSESPQIFGGKVVQENPLQKSVVAIYSEEQGGYLCSGTLITPKVILTAAHCIEKDISKIRVVFGKSLLDPNRLTRSVEAGFSHPEFNDKIKFNQKDIGLLILKGDVPAGYQPAEMLQDPTQLQAGSLVQVLGYGISWPLPGGEADKKGAGLLREVNLKISEPHFSRTEVSLIQGPLRGGMCNGDSGGPAFVVHQGKQFLWGVGSRARGALFASCILDSVYTRIDMYAPWVRQVLSKYNSESK